MWGLFRIAARFQASLDANPGLDANYWADVTIDILDLGLDLLGAPPEAPDAYLGRNDVPMEECYRLSHPRTAYSHAWDDAIEAADLEDEEQCRAAFEEMWAEWQTIQAEWVPAS